MSQPPAGPRHARTRSRLPPSRRRASRRVLGRWATGALVVVVTAVIATPTVNLRGGGAALKARIVQMGSSNGWTAGNASMAVVAGHDGHSALRLTNDTGATGTITVDDTVNTVESTRRGFTYAASVWVRAPEPSISVGLRLGEWKNTTAQAAPTRSSARLIDGDWREVRISYTAVSDDASIDVNFLAWQVPAGQAVLVSDPSLTVWPAGDGGLAQPAPASDRPGGASPTPPSLLPSGSGPGTLPAPTSSAPAPSPSFSPRTSPTPPRSPTSPGASDPEASDPEAGDPEASDPEASDTDTPTRSGTDGASSASTRDSSASPGRSTPRTSEQSSGSSGPSSSADRTGAPAPSIDSPGYRLVWNDEFDGSKVDGSKWSVRNDFCAGNEYSTMTDRSDNVFVSDGALTLRGLREDYTACGTTRHYTSGYLDTIGKQSWKYGRWEMRARMSTTKGSWPAFWLRADHTEGEIDILEAIGGLSGFTSQTVLRSTNDGSVKKTQVYTVPGELDSWHTYGFTKTASAMSWDIDAKVVYTVEASAVGWLKSSFDDTMNIRLNQQIGGSMPTYWKSDVDGGSRFPSDYSIDWIRVFQN